MFNKTAPEKTVTTITTYYGLSLEDQQICREIIGRITGKKPTGRFTFSLGQGAIHAAELKETGETSVL